MLSYAKYLAPLLATLTETLSFLLFGFHKTPRQTTTLEALVMFMCIGGIGKENESALYKSSLYGKNLYF